MVSSSGALIRQQSSYGCLQAVVLVCVCVCVYVCVRVCKLIASHLLSELDV